MATCLAKKGSIGYLLWKLSATCWNFSPLFSCRWPGVKRLRRKQPRHGGGRGSRIRVLGGRRGGERNRFVSLHNICYRTLCLPEAPPPDVRKVKRIRLFLPRHLSHPTCIHPPGNLPRVRFRRAYHIVFGYKGPTNFAKHAGAYQSAHGFHPTPAPLPRTATPHPIPPSPPPAAPTTKVFHQQASSRHLSAPRHSDLQVAPRSGRSSDRPELPSATAIRNSSTGSVRRPANPHNSRSVSPRA